MKKYWFKAKKYGWGWGLPVTWQGWVVFGVYGLFILWYLNYVKGLSDLVNDKPLSFVLLPILATIILIGICWKTGEPPRWRWGDESKESEKSKKG